MKYLQKLYPPQGWTVSVEVQAQPGLNALNYTI